MKSVTLQSPLDHKRVQCDTCAHHCIISDGEFGQCGVRKNDGGNLLSLVYGRAAASNIDPIEKKPLFHFKPGQRAFSIATVGCNLSCCFCQNYHISQMPVDAGRIAGETVLPDAIINAALRQRCHIMAYTYTEPAIYWDYAYDMAVIAREHGLANVFVTNGFWSGQGLKGMLPVMDAANVDLKAFSDDTYRDYCGARIKPVLDTIAAMHAAGVWVEVTTLVIPGLNDSDEELRDIARFLHDIDADMPWHVSRFHPGYRMTDRPVTPFETLQRAKEIGESEGLRYVYTGNLPDDDGMSTHCPACHVVVIRRIGFSIAENILQEGACPGCGEILSGIWQ
ncbi:AmmeMemoRadiSam system radical SAM enzyme [bacterium]|nr:AmmeMemoRadiSam system radical SAM enzyme [bacterium]